ncbi:sugar phosphate nucleotidyltransferase [Heyndrickxia ginsengihumi]|uniref:Glucose-1-phosphate thymidylyltransferase n=1 Tax=Heyndrickxia ginsengihumi TaxID=363870 RepID=A0A0A6VF29_9BACI|nr:sugar phosphate nucleotidyltransferase [Heyndrickxia ginsengihumi]KHD85169.1 hypothetical protein NG54_10895 [Heyndrickxia ginsengihumi]MBE6185286.1 glucose-1-phosphate thymidylyltransferase [Bacillus sp. (in: firmicutes)]MCM3025013.1 sugar phosphate nucleotidyltransferase [Heyndrickxia ginsengihumi]NEY18809.1 NTP transferase domain-containing protein [Heyndrickxia ginsengihumi]
MKGVVLAGGTGTRLYPITKAVNKHLLPIGKYPMIYWPILKLKEAGITDILIITNAEFLPAFQKLLADGKDLDVNISYAAQQGAAGIAAALLHAKDFVGNDRFVVILGDNIFKDSLKPFIKQFQEQPSGAKVLLKEVEDPNRFGVAVIDKGSNSILNIVEKPQQFLSNYIVTGIYMYDGRVFDFIQSIAPSNRGELEISDVNNQYIKHSKLTYNVLSSWWIDAGTHESLYLANKMIYQAFNDEMELGT